MRRILFSPSHREVTRSFQDIVNHYREPSEILLEQSMGLLRVMPTPASQRASTWPPSTLARHLLPRRAEGC